MKAFIFDMDGVIIDSEPLHRQIKMAAFRHFGLDFDEADCAKYVGMTSRDLFAEVIAASGKSLDADAVAKYKHDLFIDTLKNDSSLQPIDGIMELVENLRRHGIKMALASSSNRRVIDLVMKRFSLKDKFASILSGGDLPKSKPDPAVYLLSAKNLGVNPKDCVVLEDAAAGILAAKRAGMYVVAYRNMNSGAQDLSLADEIVSSIKDVNVGRLFAK
jgi:HAD superfamily hydrolase (TIGR01509 family)